MWVLQAFIFLGICNISRTSEILTRTFRWDNLRQLVEAGWVQSHPDLTKPYPSPIDMERNLLNLNRNFTDEVWGGKATTTTAVSNTFILNMASVPVYCGIVNASIDIRFYQKVKDSTTSLYPVIGYGTDYKRPIYTTEGPPKWQVISSVINLQRWMGIQLFYTLQPGELIIFDEITLTYTAQQDEDSCPYYCNHDCEYRPIGCHYYYTCVDRMYKEVRSCAADKGLAFNPMTKTCDFKENVPGCGGPPPVTCDCSYRAHESSNSLYYYCPDSCQLERCQERACPPGLVWKQESNQCDL